MSAIKIHVMHCGRVRIDRALPFREKTLHPASWTGWLRDPGVQIWLPVTCYLIEHPKGLVLVDTGWHADVRLDQEANLGGFHLSLNKAELPEGEAVHEQLAQRGVRPRDLDYVVVTHLHSDHGGGLHHVKEAGRILVSDVEFKFGEPNRKVWADTKFEPFAFKASEHGPKRAAFDLFGDGSLQFVHTPGHTAGLVSTLVRGSSKYFLMFADCGYATRSWEQMILPGITWDLEEAKRSLEWVAMMSRAGDCAESHASHQYSAPHTIEL